MIHFVLDVFMCRKDPKVPDIHIVPTLGSKVYRYSAYFGLFVAPGTGRRWTKESRSGPNGSAVHKTNLASSGDQCNVDVYYKGLNNWNGALGAHDTITIIRNPQRSIGNYT